MREFPSSWKRFLERKGKGPAVVSCYWILRYFGIPYPLCSYKNLRMKTFEFQCLQAYLQSAVYSLRSTMSILLVTAILFFGSEVLALFPDCVNGPLRNNTVCDTSACKFPLITHEPHCLHQGWEVLNQLLSQEQLLWSPSSLSKKSSSTPAIQVRECPVLGYHPISGGERPFMVLHHRLALNSQILEITTMLLHSRNLSWWALLSMMPSLLMWLPWLVLRYVHLIMQTGPG